MVVFGLVSIIAGEGMATVASFAFALVILAVAGRERVRVLSVTYQVEVARPT